MRGPRPAAALCAAAALLLASGAGSSLPESTTLDEGTFVVSQSQRTVRAERFTLTQLGDSLTVQAVSCTSRTGRVHDHPDRRMQQLLGAHDFAMHRYWSEQMTGRDTLKRGIVVVGNDTAMTVYREHHGRGIGDKIAVPPGRMYILDGPVFTPFNVLGRSLAGKVFDRREVSMFVLGGRDTMIRVTVVDLGPQRLRWGGHATSTRKLEIADQTAHYLAWFTPDGRMLRLERTEVGLRVEREAPATKRAPTGRR